MINWSVNLNAQMKAYLSLNILNTQCKTRINFYAFVSLIGCQAVNMHPYPPGLQHVLEFIIHLHKHNPQRVEIVIILLIAASKDFSNKFQMPKSIEVACIER